MGITEMRICERPATDTQTHLAQEAGLHALRSAAAETGIDLGRASMTTPEPRALGYLMSRSNVFSRLPALRFRPCRSFCRIRRNGCSQKSPHWGHRPQDNNS